VAVGFRAPSSDELTSRRPGRRPGAPADAVFDLEAVEPDQARTDGARPSPGAGGAGRGCVAVVVVLAALGGGLYAAAKNKVFTASHPVPPWSARRSHRPGAGREGHFTLVERRPSTRRRLRRVVEHSRRTPTSLKRAAGCVTARRAPTVTVPSSPASTAPPRRCSPRQPDRPVLSPPTAARCDRPVINWSYDNVFNATSAPYTRPCSWHLERPRPVRSLGGGRPTPGTSHPQRGGFQSSETSRPRPRCRGQAIGTIRSGRRRLKAPRSPCSSPRPALVNVPSVVADGGVGHRRPQRRGIQAGASPALGPQTQTTGDSTSRGGASVPIGSSVTLSFSAEHGEGPGLRALRGGAPHTCTTRTTSAGGRL